MERRRYRLLPVEPIAVVSFFIIYAGLVNMVPVAYWLTGLTERQLSPDGAKFNEWAGHVLLVSAALYGLVRAMAFHPFWHGPYRRWLELTPWAPGVPLPLQPLHLRWQDVLALATLTLLALRHPELHPSQPLVLFGFTYLLPTTVALLAGGPAGGEGAGIVLLAGLPVVLLPAVGGWWAAAVLAALYPLARVGTRASLARLVRNAAGPPEPARGQGGAAGGVAAADRAVGWPLRQLSPADPPAPIGAGEALLASVLVGWWTYAACMFVYKVDPPEAAIRVQVGLLIAGGLAVTRLLRYIMGHAPPIGVFGRLATGRLVIPGYDKVVVAPACVLLAGVELSRLLAFTPLGLVASSAIVLSVSLFLSLALGPTLADWHLTGYHRLVPVTRGGGAAGAANAHASPSAAGGAPARPA